MFSREKPTQQARPQSSELETLIGSTTSVRGDLHADGGIRIDGVFEGTIETTGNLIVGEGAKIVADITAHNIQVAGAIKGNISANRLEVLETGRIWGDVTINSFLLEEGGFIRGEIKMQTDIAPPQLEPPKPDAEVVEGEAVESPEE